LQEEYKEGDFIFINDYHLMLLPSLVKKRLPNAKIGFFMHIPWPTSELYRSLPVRYAVIAASSTQPQR
jgi:trehalose 6-phosphate synthase/phosphatase